MKYVLQACIPGLILAIFSVLAGLLLCVLYQVPAEFMVLLVILQLAAGLILLLYKIRQMKKALAALRARDYSPESYLPEQRPLLSALEESEDQIQDIRLASMNSRAGLMDYFSLWAHQAKLPIAAIRLSLEAGDLSANDLRRQLFRLEQCVSSSMAYVRLESDSTDFLIRQQTLGSIVRPVIRQYSSEFIARKIRLNYEADDSLMVLTDEKWLAFAIEQLLSNALKYTPEGGTIRIYTEGHVLHILDSGPGIDPADLPRIFEKGFTGENGHGNRSESSGIGLYLTERILKILHHPFRISSPSGTDAQINLSSRSLSGPSENELPALPDLSDAVSSLTNL